MATSKKLRYGEGTVTSYTLADGTAMYRARWHDDGRARSRSFISEAAAREHLIGMSTDKRLGRYVQASDLTVHDAVASYLKRNADRWTTNTVASYSQVARSHVYPYLGNERVAQLTTSMVQNWVDKLARKKLSASTISNAKLILGGTCIDLVRLGDLPRNPVTGVRVPPRRRTTKQVWDEGQVRTVIATATRLYPLMAVYYRVALTTGMRPGEVRALKWGDIDFSRGVITCQRTITRDENFRQIVGTSTKTHKARSIAVPASTITALQALRKEQLERRLAAEHWAATDLVFDRGDGHLIAQQTLRNRHEVICREAGVPQIRFHDTRHSAAVLMLRAGVNLKVVSEVLGHKSITITADTYLQVDVDMQRSATNLLGDIMEG